MAAKPPTDPTGLSFLSNRRSRLAEAELLLRAQHELGVPTWQDVEDLDEAYTDTQLRQVLADPTTANAVLWLTPEDGSAQAAISGRGQTRGRTILEISRLGIDPVTC